MSAKGGIIRYITTMVIIGLAVLMATIFHNNWKEIGQVGPADARASAYFEQHSEPDCRFEGTWHDWERDEWMTLGCLTVKDEHREGMLATHNSPGQGTLQIPPEKAPDGMMAVIVITNKKTGEALRYSISDEWLPKILACFKSDPPTRYDEAMSAEDLFRVEPVK